ncbi:Phosphoinositide phosphatase SAC1 [Smittium mucronatum]|uniref:Phosphoinositide phosphatase SAC1 n=1 Tax=Smittium mucronatum TaxID=133383 RepID=A0A1R0H633_9FUNG|nr:Phosphoinositide phosphatase SAC1 [Smittium mucronatum]
MAETEEIIEFSARETPGMHSTTQESPQTKRYVSSFIQIRGSIPIKFAQIINGRYRPRLYIDDTNSCEPFKKHIFSLVDKYKAVLMINLVDKFKYELPLGLSFERQFKTLSLPSISYIHFDFHAQSKANKSAPVGNLLVNSVSRQVDSFGGFRLEVDSNSILEVQNGVVRTNCLDCLDRTNVIQSSLSNYWLNRELTHFGILTPGESVDNHSQMLYLLRNIWSDNADYVSLAYSGSPALKTDLTRTGRRTFFGMVSDFSSSVERFICGNFFDGDRQIPIIYLSSTFVSLTFTMRNRGFSPIGTFFTSLSVSVASYLLIVTLTGLVSPRLVGYLLNWPSLVPYQYKPRPFVGSPLNYSFFRTNDTRDKRK